VGESAESTGGVGQQLEPVSASNRENFDLLADYNTSAPFEHRTQKKQTADQDAGKPSPEGTRLPGRRALPARMTPPPVLPGRQPYSGPKPNPAIKPGGER
jgi:hypothetical protein